MLGVTIDRLLAEAADALDVRLRVAEDGMLAMRFAADAVVALEASGAPFERAAEPKSVASVPLRERIG